MPKVKTPFPKLNEKLIAKVLAHIKGENFKRFEQDIVGIAIPKGMTPEDFEEIFGGLNSGIPSCRTKGCFGGWGVLLSTPKKKWPSLFNARDTILSHKGDMKEGTLRKAEKLFGFTGPEAHYVFNYIDEHSSGSADDYKIILKRLAMVRKSRQRWLRLQELKKQIWNIQNKKSTRGKEQRLALLEKEHERWYDDSSIFHYDNLD